MVDVSKKRMAKIPKKGWIVVRDAHKTIVPKIKGQKSLAKKYNCMLSEEISSFHERGEYILTRSIWLIDATSYKKDIDYELRKIKKDYFKIKSFARQQIIGKHVLPTQKTFSTGLLRIATLLRRMGYSIEYFHLEDFLSQKIIERYDILPMIAAFGCVCPTIPICDRLAKEIKNRDDNVITAVGGAHINVALKETMQRYTSFDRYVYGYDKEAVSRLINDDIDDSIDYIPYVDYSILPYSLNEYDINIFSTLGCPFKCAYCQDGQVPYYEYLLDGGISMIQEKLVPKKLIHFFDSTLGYSESRLLQVCEKLSNINHKFILSCDIRAEFITEKSIAALEKAGFKEIRLGLETIDKEVLRRNNREILPDAIMKKIRIIRNASELYLTLYTVSGLPGYTLETYKKNKEVYKYLLETRSVDEIKNAQYVPYPRDNTDFHQRGIIIKDNNWENYDRQSYPVYETTELSRQQIWNEFLDTAKVINEAWLKRWKIHSIDELSNLEVYPEYIVGNYLERRDIAGG